MKIVFAVVLLVLGAGITGLYMLNVSESNSNHFSSYKDAKKSGLIEKGWIPPFIPKSAYNIKEQHRVDQSYINVEFNFDPKEIAAFEQACSSISAVKFKCDNSGHPVIAIISDGNQAVIKSYNNGT